MSVRSDERVVVVGGGVSGSACAIGLAVAGRRVLVVSSSLDTLGMPGYGSDLFNGACTWGEALRFARRLPPSLRRVWLGEAMVSSGGHPRFSVDRRGVGLETKWLLENVEGVEIRQGVAVGIRPARAKGENRRQVCVETAFGEEFSGSACVLAVGLGLSGRIRLGVEELLGGRYGEVPADELRARLVSSGVSLRSVVKEVGTWRAAAAGAKEEKVPVDLKVGVEAAAVSGTVTFSRLQDIVRLGGIEGIEGAESWEGVLDEEEKGALAAAESVAKSRVGQPVAPERAAGAEVAPGKGEEAVEIPDGVATREWYRETDAGVGAGVDTRLGHRVHAEILDRVGPGGLIGGGISAAGRVAGAETYADSIESGLDCALALTGALSDRGKRGNGARAGVVCGEGAGREDV